MGGVAYKQIGCRRVIEVTDLSIKIVIVGFCKGIYLNIMDGNNHGVFIFDVFSCFFGGLLRCMAIDLQDCHRTAGL